MRRRPGCRVARTNYSPRGPASLANSRAIAHTALDSTRVAEPWILRARPLPAATTRTTRRRMPHTRDPRTEPIEQPSLFLPEPVVTTRQPAAARAPIAEIPPLTPASPLAACALPYQDHLRRTDHSVYTV